MSVGMGGVPTPTLTEEDHRKCVEARVANNRARADVLRKVQRQELHASDLYRLRGDPALGKIRFAQLLRALGRTKWEAELDRFCDIDPRRCMSKLGEKQWERIVGRFG